MRVGVARVLVVSAACTLWLVGCGTSKFSDLKPKEEGLDAAMASVEPPAAVEANASVPVESEPLAAPGLLGSQPDDHLNLGKKQFRENNFGLAERHFRRAVEQHPRDAESWIGLAASYDRLRRFDLADRAYAQAIKILGPTVEILNNQGYSYMLRGNYKRAHATLMVAQAKAPDNPYVKNNLLLLAESYRKGKAIQ
jgi:Flp pilus assembly protein TadD